MNSSADAAKTLWVAILLAAFVGLVAEKGWKIAISYAVLAIGIVISGICFRLAWEIWRHDPH